MSNYHYGDQRGGCQNCFQMGRYVDLQNLTNYSCDQYCICRHTSERSTRDQMNYDYYVLGKPLRIPPMKQVREGYTIRKV